VLSLPLRKEGYYNEDNPKYPSSEPYWYKQCSKTMDPAARS